MITCTSSFPPAGSVSFAVNVCGCNWEIIPELIQKECNAKEIYNSVVYFLKNPELMKKQINECDETLTKIRSKTSSSDEASSVLTKFLIS